MINVMRTVSAAAAIKTPAIINCADAQLAALGPSIGFRIRNSLACVLRDFPPAAEMG